MNHDENVARVVEVIKSYCELQRDKDFVDACVKTYKELWRDRPKEVLTLVVADLYNGLAYGNWPWVIRDLNPHIRRRRTP